MDVLKKSTNGEFQSIIDTRMAAFIIFIIALAVAYLILWTPFVNRLNREVRIKHIFVVDMAHEVNADHYTDRGDSQDTEDTRVLAQSELLLREIRRRQLRLERQRLRRSN